MRLSINGGTPKSSILIGFSLVNQPFWGTPIYGNPQMRHRITWIVDSCWTLFPSCLGDLQVSPTDRYLHHTVETVEKLTTTNSLYMNMYVYIYIHEYIYIYIYILFTYIYSYLFLLFTINENSIYKYLQPWLFTMNLPTNSVQDIWAPLTETNLSAEQPLATGHRRI